MASSQDTLSQLDQARRGVRSALDTLGQISDDVVPRLTNDGIQHELRAVDERLQALRNDLEEAGKSSAKESK